MKDLTPPQEECIQLLAQGKTYSQIAEHMNIRETTVRSHLHVVYQKLDVFNAAQAVAKYLTHGESVFLPNAAPAVAQARRRLNRLAELAYRQGNPDLGNEISSIVELLG